MHSKHHASKKVKSKKKTTIYHECVPVVRADFTAVLCIVLGVPQILNKHLFNKICFT